MSLDVLLALRAAARHQAVPRASRRHVHLTHQPFVVVGYHVPGEPGLPLGFLCGTQPDRPYVIAVGEPRNAARQWKTLKDFASELNRYLSAFVTPTAGGRGSSLTAAPQIVVANTDTARWLCQDLGLFMRYLDPTRNAKIDPALPLAGAHLSFFDQQRVPGACLVLAMTEALALHWKTGQLPFLDAHLASQLAWISRPESTTDAESQLPAGPVPDPAWERGDFTHTMNAYRQLITVSTRSAAAEGLARDTVRRALHPAWEDVWEAAKLLTSLPPAEHVAERAAADVYQWQRHAERICGNRAYFRRRPRQLQVFRQLNRLERLTANLNRQMALDDPVIMARYVASGEALSATVLDIRGDDTARAGRRRPRPVIRVKPDIGFTRPVGTTLWWRAAPELSGSGPQRRPTIEFQVTELGTDGTIELTVQRNAVAANQRHRLPEPGTHLVLAPFEPLTFRPDAIPDELPWTHREPEDDT